MTLDNLLHLASLAALIVCAVAYVWGYVLRAAQLRWLSVVALFCTTAALLHVTLLLGGDTSVGVSLPYISIFLTLSGLCQASTAIQARKRAGDRRAEDIGPPVGRPERRVGPRRAAG